MIPRTFPSSVASNGSAQMIVYFLPSVSGLTRWVDYIPVKFTTVATAATENTYNQNGYIPVVSISSIAGATPFKEYVPVYLDSSAMDAEVWKVNVTGFIPVGTAGIGGAALYMDFAATTTLDPRVTFSRTSNATLTNSAGLVAYAPHNLLTFSEQFDNAVWLKSEVTVSANTAVAPDGTTTADKVIASTVSGLHYLRYNATVPAGTATVSFRFKAGEYSAAWISLDGASNYAQYNLTGSGTASSTGAATPTITKIGDYYLCTATQTLAAGTAAIFAGVEQTYGTLSFAGNNTNGIYIWGAQLELGSTATTYNPTTVKNLLGYTEHFDNAAWTKSNASISATKVDDIYGQPFAQKLVESAVNNVHYVGSVPTTTVAGTVYTLTWYLKAAERTWARIETGGAGLLQNSVFVNLATGVFGTTSTGSFDSKSITDMGNGWYRVALVKTAAATGSAGGYVYTATADTVSSYTGDGTSGIYIFGAQLSDSASADPYVYNPVAAPTAQAYYGPRFDYDPVTLAPKGLLIEEQRTNLLLRSGSVGLSPWAVAGTATLNAAVAPDGTVTATRYTALAQYNSINQSISCTANTTYTMSGWVKLVSGTTSQFILQAYDGTTYNTQIIAATSQWVRFSKTFTTSGTATNISFGFQDNSASSFATLDLWGAQLEAGAFATSYIPTVASQVTRAADSASMIGNNFARWFNVNEGSVFASFIPSQNSNTPSIWGQSTSDTSGGYFAAQFNHWNGAATLGNAGAITLNQTNKTVLAYTGTASRAGAANAGAVTTSATTVGTFNTIRLGATGGSTQFLNGTIKQFSFYPRRLTNAELQGITS